MQKEFTKADLKDGMVVEYKDGKRRLVVADMLIGQDSWLGLSEFNYDLKCSEANCESIDIVKVCKTKRPRSFGSLLDDDNLELIWQRTETKRMTAEEMRVKLEEMTGNKIEIESSKEEMIGAIEIYCCNHGCRNCSIRKECDNEDAGFCKSNLELIKQCYEKVIEDERKES